MTDELIGLFLLLLLNIFFSSSGIAFIAANKIKVEIRAGKNNLPAKNVKFFLNNPDIFFSTILILNSIVNVTFASLGSIFFLRIFGLHEVEILLVSAALILFAGKLVPAYFGRKLADGLFIISAIPLRLITIVSYPFIKFFASISAGLSRAMQKKEEEILNIFDKEDIQNLIEGSSESGKMDEEQSNMIGKVIDIRGQRVYEAMTPRTDIVGVEINSTMQDVIDLFIKSGYSKIPVYDENLDNIKGIVFTKDIFKQPQDLKTVMREVVFVPETKKSLEMLNEFLDKQFSFAVVVDEFGGTAGILTTEDLIEELFGEIRDEFDDPNKKVAKKLDANSYLLSGKVEVDHLNEEFDFKIPEGDYETIAGYVTFKLGRIPVKGESFKIDDYSVQILKSDKTKIDMLKLTIENRTES